MSTVVPGFQSNLGSLPGLDAKGEPMAPGQ